MRGRSHTSPRRARRCRADAEQNACARGTLQHHAPNKPSKRSTPPLHPLAAPRILPEYAWRPSTAPSPRGHPCTISFAPCHRLSAGALCCPPLTDPQLKHTRALTARHAERAPARAHNGKSSAGAQRLPSEGTRPAASLPQGQSSVRRTRAPVKACAARGLPARACAGAHQVQYGPRLNIVLLGLLVVVHLLSRKDEAAGGESKAARQARCQTCVDREQACNGRGAKHRFGPRRRTAGGTQVLGLCLGPGLSWPWCAARRSCLQVATRRVAARAS